MRDAYKGRSGCKDVVCNGSAPHPLTRVPWGRKGTGQVFPPRPEMGAGAGGQIMPLPQPCLYDKLVTNRKIHDFVCMIIADVRFFSNSL
jgi:hypothetical protein